MDAKNRAKTQTINEFLTDCIQLSRNFEQIVSNSQRLVSFWEDNNFNELLTIEDLEPYRFSKEELQDFVSLMRQVLLFTNNQSIVPGDYQQINNKIK